MTTETFVADAAGRPTIIKDPNAVLDYTFDWSSWLAGDVIISVDPEVSNSTSAFIVTSGFDNTHVTVWVASGNVGEKIYLRCRIHTAAGRVDDRTVYLKVKER